MVGVAVELALDGVLEALDNKVVPLPPGRMAPIVGGRDVSSQENSLAILFTLPELLYKPGQLMVRIGRVGEEVEVGEITYLGVEHDHLEVAHRVGIVALLLQGLVGRGVQLGPEQLSRGVE